ncbi:MAG: tetratricopeptide repeat protein [Desulfomonile tiedjei]|uniref:Tetratricopeptide repeat protein n=1 Tax=Desulfomonile tiedjei TaxID=2358 RepID=A0A9D6V0S3_9BACT|nr:tetratricopeptide repeat protein [Desulfomonile tiedjei]
MDAVTYPEEKVIEFIHENFIPVRVPFDHKPLASDFNIKWTPTIITVDPDGKEHFRTVGFLAAPDLIASLLLAIGKTHFEHEHFDKAIAVFESLLSSHPKSSYAPEAIYLRGVSQYKSTHNPKPLKAAYERLSADYPNDEWTKRAYPYRLIN